MHFIKDDDEVISKVDNWAEGFPRTRPALSNVMWKVFSNPSFAHQGGFINAPKEATGYPLCKKDMHTGKQLKLILHPCY